MDFFPPISYFETLNRISGQWYPSKTNWILKLDQYANEARTITDSSGSEFHKDGSKLYEEAKLVERIRQELVSAVAYLSLVFVRKPEDLGKASRPCVGSACPHRDTADKTSFMADSGPGVRTQKEAVPGMQWKHVSLLNIKCFYKYLISRVKVPSTPNFFLSYFLSQAFNMFWLRSTSDIINCFQGKREKNG